MRLDSVQFEFHYRRYSIWFYVSGLAPLPPPPSSFTSQLRPHPHLNHASILHLSITPPSSTSQSRLHLPPLIYASIPPHPPTPPPSSTSQLRLHPPPLNHASTLHLSTTPPYPPLAPGRTSDWSRRTREGTPWPYGSTSSSWRRNAPGPPCPRSAGPDKTQNTHTYTYTCTV